MNFLGGSYLLSGFHFARGLPRFLGHWLKALETLAGYGAQRRDCGAGLMEQGSGECWWPGAQRSGQVLLGKARDAAGRAGGCPALAPTVLASGAEAGASMGTLLLLWLGPPHRHSACACSGPAQAQSHPHAGGPCETGQDLLLECGGVDAAESELQTQSWNRFQQFGTSRALGAMQGQMQQEKDLLQAVTEVLVEAPGVLGYHPQHWREAWASQTTEKTLAGLTHARQAGCSWTDYPERYSGASVY